MTKGIQKVVDDFMAALKAEAEQSVLTQFAKQLKDPSPPPRPTKKVTIGTPAVAKTEKAGKPARRPAPGSLSPRRESQVIDSLADKLYVYIAKHGPGVAMVDIARGLGVQASALRHPLNLLKDQGRVKATGNTRSTTYTATTSSGPRR